jgi:hypothetical protein
MQDIRMKENEEFKAQNAEQVEQWEARQRAQREQMMQSKRMVRGELDQQVQLRNIRKQEMQEMDKMYGVAFQMKVEQDSKQHAENVAKSKKYITNDPLVIVSIPIS